MIILKTADKQARILRVLAPLGVLLPSGLGLRVDNADIGRAGFVRCLPNGCIAEVILEEDLLSKLQAGSQATFIIFQTPEEGIGIPISLNGFSAASTPCPDTETQANKRKAPNRRLFVSEILVMSLAVYSAAGASGAFASIDRRGVTL